MLNQPRSEEDHKNVIEQGFTLIELLIVIVILGILAGIVVFAVSNLTEDAAKNACKTEVATVQSAAEAFKARRGTYPTMAEMTAGVTAQTAPATVLPAVEALLKSNPKSWNTSTAIPPAAPSANQFSYNSSTGVVTGDPTTCV